MDLIQKTKQYNDQIKSFILNLDPKVLIRMLSEFEMPSPGQIAEFLARKWDELLRALFVSNYVQSGVQFEDYIRAVEDGTLSRCYFLGVADKEQGFLIRDPVVQPGLIAIGGQGSGKSTTVKGVLVTLQASSSDIVFLNLIDVSSKGMGDFSSLFTMDNVATTLFDKKKLIPSISMAFNELKMRGEAFRNIGSFENWLAKKQGEQNLPEAKPAEKLYDYEEKYEAIYFEYQEIWKKIFSKQALSQNEKDRLLWIYEKNILNQKEIFLVNLKKVIDGVYDSEALSAIELKDKPKKVALYVLAFEEFHEVCTSPEVNFAENHNTEGSIAWQLKKIARTGRSLGISMIIATQRATYLEIPNDLKAGITNVLAHKLGSSNDASAFNLGHAEQILSSQRGRSAYEEGFVQFPYFSPSVMDKLLRDYAKPFNGFLFGDQIQDYKDILSGEGSDGLVDNSPLKFLIANYQMFDKLPLAQRILGEFGFEILDEKYPSMELDAVVLKDGIRYSLMVIAPSGSRGLRSSGVSDKKITNLQKEMSANNTESVIIISFDTISSSVSKLAQKTGGYAVDKEDLTKIADILDNAEITKANGTFETLYKEIPFVKSEDKSAKTEDTQVIDEDDDFMKRFKFD